MTGNIPDGFVRHVTSPFINHVGPFLQAGHDPLGEVRLALQVDTLHSNMIGVMHGGLIATMADSAMARALTSQLRRRSVTLKMTLEYLEAIRKGDWVVAHGKLVGHDAQLAHTRCEIRVGDAIKAQATGVFRLLKPIE